MGIEDCVGQGIEGPSAILAPEPADPVGGKAKSLDGRASVVPAFLYIQRVEQLNLAGIRDDRMFPVIIALIALIDECLERCGFRHIGPGGLPPGFRSDSFHVVVLCKKTEAR